MTNLRIFCRPYRLGKLAMLLHILCTYDISDIKVNIILLLFVFRICLLSFLWLILILINVSINVFYVASIGKSLIIMEAHSAKYPESMTTTFKTLFMVTSMLLRKFPRKLDNPFGFVDFCAQNIQNQSRVVFLFILIQLTWKFCSCSSWHLRHRFLWYHGNIVLIALVFYLIFYFFFWEEDKHLF